MEIIVLVLVAACLLYFVIEAAWILVCIGGVVGILYFFVSWLIQKIKKVVKK